jgi:hypothetical protein
MLLLKQNNTLLMLKRCPQVCRRTEVWVMDLEET